MHLDHLLSPRCVPCPDPPPPCNCSPSQTCFQINRDCNVCSSFTCVDNKTSSKSSGGVSKGSLAGAVIGSLIFLAIAISAFLWYRRKLRLRRESAEETKDIPAPAETVLNRPDPSEKLSRPPTERSTVRVFSTHSDTTIDLDPESQTGSVHTANRTSSRGSASNPFEDNQSIQTTGTGGTNVIPIALVPADLTRNTPSPSYTSSISNSMSPVRPIRTPEIDLNLEHVNMSRDSSLHASHYASSQISGLSSRNSYLSNASYSSELLEEAPMIITPKQGAVRQVLGVVKAEMVNAPGSQHPSLTSSESLKSPRLSRPAARSPLAAPSFGPSDIPDEEQDSTADNNPFDDQHSPALHDATVSSPAASTTTFGSTVPRTSAQNSAHSSSVPSQWVTTPLNVPRSTRPEASTRPSSISTQAGSIIDIASATRVNVAYATSPQSGGTLPRSPFRQTMARLVTPPTKTTVSLAEQQQKALAHAQARAQAQAFDTSRNKRLSSSSVLTAASRSDSILESFPFVPPSPISDRPIRSPPVSPLSKQTFNSSPSSPTYQVSLIPASPLKETSDGAHADKAELSSPLDRRALGLSTGSQFSTASSGLGSFPFQIDSGSGAEASAPPTSFNKGQGRQRASLDTLALTSDLSSYPLGFDRDAQDARDSFNAFAGPTQP